MKFSEYLKEKKYGIKNINQLINMLAESNIDFKALKEYQDSQQLSSQKIFKIIEDLEKNPSTCHINSEEDIRKYINENGLTKAAKHYDISVDELRTYHLHKRGIRAEEEERISVENAPAIDLFKDD